MAVDIAPELYERIQRRFQEKYDKAMLYDPPISDMRRKLEAGEATFQDADIYAVEVGSMLSDSMLEVLQLEEMLDCFEHLLFHLLIVLFLLLIEV